MKTLIRRLLLCAIYCGFWVCAWLDSIARYKEMMKARNATLKAYVVEAHEKARTLER